MGNVLGNVWLQPTHVGTISYAIRMLDGKITVGMNCNNSKGTLKCRLEFVTRGNGVWN